MDDRGPDQQKEGVSGEVVVRAEVLTDPYDPEVVLDPREKGALTYFKTSGSHAVAADTAERMFFLFLRGLGTEDIRKLAPGFSLAQIVHARVVGKWDRRRAEYDAQLTTTGVETVNRARAELAVFLGDAIAAATAVGREKLQRYALSRNPDDLGSLELSTMKDLKAALELLLKTTGQDAPAKREPQPAPPVSVTGDGATVNVLQLGPNTTVSDLAAARRAARRGGG
jgi:hypothetical protein